MRILLRITGLAPRAREERVRLMLAVAGLEERRDGPAAGPRGRPDGN